TNRTSVRTKDTTSYPRESAITVATSTPLSVKKKSAASAMLGSSEATNGSTVPIGTPLATARMIDAPAIESTYCAALNQICAADLRANRSAATRATERTQQAARGPACTS